MERFEVHVELVFDALTPLRRSLNDWLEQRGMSEPPRAAVVLATHEAAANAIEHSAAASPVTVRGESRLDHFLIEITDDGVWKTPTEPAGEERGRGLEIIRSLVSQAEVSRGTNGTTVRLIQDRA